MVIAAEFIVVSEYLNGSGFAEFGLSKLEIVQLAKELFHVSFCNFLCVGKTSL